MICQALEYIIIGVQYIKINKVLDFYICLTDQMMEADHYVDTNHMLATFD